MKKIPLTKGQFALVDDEDFEMLTARSWQCVIYKNGNKYARSGTKFKGIPRCLHMHREIMRCPDHMDVDHIDGDGLNNQKYNLRICTRSQNHMNRRSYGKHGLNLKGATYNKKRNKWMGFIRQNGKTIYLGTFKTPELAAEKYNEKASELFGEYARLNPI